MATNALALVLLVSSLLTPTGQPTPLQKGEFVLAAPSRVVSWAMKRLAPPSHLYVTPDDVLHVAAASAQVNEVVTVSYRLLRAFDSAIVYGQFTTPVMPNTTVVTQDQAMTEGFLLSVACQAALATGRGDTFVRVSLAPKALGAGPPAQVLMADYVTTNISPGYPNGRILAPTEGPGVIYLIPLPNPGAGADWVWQSKANTRVRVRAVRGTLQTSAAAGTRTVFLSFPNTPGAGTLTLVPSATQTPSTFLTYTMVNGIPLAPPTSQGVIWWAPAELSGMKNLVVNSITSNLDVADQWAGVSLMVEQWLDNV